MGNKQPKTLLVLSPAPSHPQNAGNRARIFSLLKAVEEKGFKIHFLLYDKEASASHIKKRTDKKAMYKEWSAFYYTNQGLILDPEVYINILSSKRGPAILASGYAGIYILFKTIFRRNRKSKEIRPRFFSWQRLNAIEEAMEKLIGKLGIALKKLTPGLHRALRKKWVNEDESVRIVKGFTNKIKQVQYGNDFDEQGPFKKKKKHKKNKLPYNLIDDWYDNNLDPIIRYLSEKHNYSHIMVEYVFMSKAFENFTESTVKILDTHDVFSNRDSKYKQAGLEDNFFSTIEKEESKGLNRADIILAIQEEEKEFFEDLCNKNIHTIGHQVKLLPPQKRDPLRNNILYIGPGNIANIKSVEDFIKKILPEIVARYKKAQLVLVGNICESIGPGKWIVKTGEIADLSKAYQLADVVINPVEVGTGLKIKNIEALGHSKPLVTTQYASTGYDRKGGQGFIIAVNKKEFISAILDLLLNESYYNQTAEEAYQFASNYNEEISNALDQVFLN